MGTPQRKATSYISIMLMWQIFGLLQHLSALLAIVVERNMFAYYKVQIPPQEVKLKDINSTNNVDSYYVLQCPPKVNDSIPKPKDMQICTVIDYYQQPWSGKAYHTRPIKSKQLSARTQQGKRLHMLPFKIVLHPLPPPMPIWDKKRRKRYSTPLKYLLHPHPKMQFVNLSADHKKYKRGKHNIGYQHLYHRDETYNDRIYYDEIQLDGTFKSATKENDDTKIKD